MHPDAPRTQKPEKQHANPNSLVITLLITSMAIVPGSSVLAATSADEQLTPAEAKDIAREAFLLGTPLRTAQVMV
jgi:hypothetical protein